MAQQEYLVEIGSAEDHQPVRKHFDDNGLSAWDADESWIETATEKKGRSADGLYLSVRADSAADLDLHGHGWDI
ncbi:hypothetical protein QMK17_26240 [Rhodococcus sp. G-MC3]|uniref:hypothetical protein n=1 Tax=Rhodococcus sp. G-MC3 TaxID=3046209 RepID=UPI0024B91E81|nr:hypothetical protein [Rhodococcus sp. G-MC3]MDJ0396790.1 hypothetical protein [Rhodococcus sp. G-MC3]